MLKIYTMKKSYHYFITLLFISIFFCFVACNKDNDTTTTFSHSQTIKGISNIIIASYDELNAQVGQLETDVQRFSANATEENLTKAKTTWKKARLAWEQTETFLYGPVKTEEIDPNIDTWPIAKDNLTTTKLQAIESQLNENYLDNAGEDLRGFHVLELILFGKNGVITAGEISAVQKIYMQLVATNMKQLMQKLTTSWQTYKASFNAPSGTNEYYKTNRELYLAVIDGMIGICEEVADGKMNEIFVNQTPELEESPYAANSIVDFTNNIQGIANIYHGTYGTLNNGGLSLLIKQYSTAAHQEIASQIQTTINAVKAITDPFGIAIQTQPQQVQNAIDAIRALQKVLEEKAKTLIEQKLI